MKLKELIKKLRYINDPDGNPHDILYLLVVGVVMAGLIILKHITS